MINETSEIVRTDEEIARVLQWAREGIARYGFGEKRLPPGQLWGDGDWQDNAWLTGVRGLLEWVTGETDRGPLLGTCAHLPDDSAIGRDMAEIDEMMAQGTGRLDDPGIVDGWPPPQAAEAYDHTHDWLYGDRDDPPACPHGGAYYCMCDGSSPPPAGFGELLTEADARRPRGADPAADS
jgi:hypothetical protein